MSTPNVSVIIPAYNCGDLVRQAIDSACKQTYNDYEVIVVDDGSTDETWEVIQQTAANRSRVRAMRAEHAGLAAARNYGISQMRGDWIALLDADDLWEQNKLQRCMNFFCEHPDLSIVYTPMAPVLMDGQRMRGHSKKCHSGWLTEKLFHSIFVHDPAVVFHKRVIETCGGFDESLPVCIGHEFWLRVSTKFEFGLIDEPLAMRRWHTSSLTRSDRVRARRIKAAMLERFYFERGGSELLTDTKKALRRLARVHYSAGKILFQRRRFQEANALFDKARQFAPTYLKTYSFWFMCRLARLLGLDRG